MYHTREMEGMEGMEEEGRTLVRDEEEKKDIQKQTTTEREHLDIRKEMGKTRTIREKENILI